MAQLKTTHFEGTNATITINDGYVSVASTSGGAGAGNRVYVSSDLVPATDGGKLGDSSNRWTAQLDASRVRASSGIGLTVEGAGSSAAVHGVGGDTSGTGVYGIGGSGANGVGVEGQATGTNDGVVGRGSASGAGSDGVRGYSGGADGTRGVYGTVAATNGIGVQGDGAGTGQGVLGTGGGTSATGVHGVGGTSDGYGVIGVGTGSGKGVFGIGTGSQANGVAGVATGSAAGVFGLGGSGAGPGVEGHGGIGTDVGGIAGVGGRFYGNNNAPGIRALGGPSSGHGAYLEAQGAGYGVVGIGGSSDGRGVSGTGQGAGTGVYGSSGSGNFAIGVRGDCNGAGGSAGHFETSVGRGVRVVGDLTNPTYAALSVYPQTGTAPSTAEVGDYYTEGETTKLRGYDGSNWTTYLSGFSAYGQLTSETTGEQTIPGCTFTIPANTLKVGQMVRARASFNWSSSTEGNMTARLRFGTDALASRGSISVASGATYTLEYYCIIRAIGGGGVARIAYFGEGWGSLSSGAIEMLSPSDNLISDDTDAAIEVRATAQFASVGNGASNPSVRFTVEIM